MKKPSIQSGGKKCGRGREHKCPKQMNGHGSSIKPSAIALPPMATPSSNASPAQSCGLPAEGSTRTPYVPPYRLRSSEQNAIIERSILEDLPTFRQRNSNTLSGRPRHSPWINNSHGGYGTGAHASLATHEADAQIRLLAWENWALRNVLMFQYGWNLESIDFALEIERQRLVSGAPTTGIDQG